ncbi:MAG: SIMPL domain-containing protein [Rhodothermia bacterium]|nr:MAG: SIMPL domain-containing protein [Rhodothermia bacterium]
MAVAIIRANNDGLSKWRSEAMTAIHRSKHRSNQRSNQKTSVALFLITLVATLQAVPAATAQTDGRTVTVSGKAVVHVLPDQVNVRFGIVTVDLDPEVARTDNARVSAATMNSVRDLGIEERKIQVNALRIQPFTEYDPQSRRNVDKGFQAVRDVSVQLNDLEILPTLIAEIVNHGANRIHGIAYELQDANAAEYEALREALENAKTKATIMVEALGARLGTALQILEQGAIAPQPQLLQFDRSVANKSLALEEANPDAYASGEIDVSAQVTVVFEILPVGPQREN